MKNLFIILFLVINIPSFAIKHYVAVGGGGAGTLISPFATIAQVNAHSFTGDDTIAFNKGDVWRETLTVPNSGTSGHYIVFTSYGTGVNPRILGSNATTWADQGGNIWKSENTFADPYGGTYDAEVFFENIGGTLTWGIHVANTGALNAEYKWCWTSNYIYVYAASDPDSRYTSVEIPQRNNIIDFNGKEYLDFSGIDLHYSIQTGTTYSGWPMVQKNGLIIEYCNIGYIGIKGSEMAYGISGGYSNCIIRHCEIHNCGRRAIDYHIYGLGYTISNVLVEDNNFHDGWHTTGVDISVGSSGYYTTSIDGFIIRRNRFYDPPTTTAFSELIFIQNSDGAVAGATLNNIFIYANIFINSSNGGIHMETANGVYIYNNTFYNHNTVSPSNTFHINIAKVSPGYCTNITIKNNIFYTTSTYTGSGGCPIFIKSGALASTSALVADYNIYYRYNNSVRVVEREGTATYNMTQLATMRSATGWETHGQFTSALMTDPANEDFTLQLGSPAIASGVGVGLTYDYAENLWLTIPSIGAYEYGSAPEDPDPPELPTITTDAITTIRSIFATLAGTTSGESITDRGLCWSTSINPSLSGTHAHIGTGEGTFTYWLTGLNGGTTYHVRSFATNSEGTVYGADIEFTTPVHSMARYNGKTLRYNGETLIVR